MSRILSISVTVILLLTCGAALAQSPLSLGLRGGLSLSKLDVDQPQVDPGMRTAFTGGGFMVIDLPGMWGIQVEALFVPRGSSEDIQLVDENGMVTGSGTATYKIDYFEIPVLARFGLGTGPVFLLAGPALGFKTQSKFTVDGLPDEELDWVSSSDLGLVLGAGATLPTGFGAVVLDARYTLGTSNINDGEGASIKNRAFLVSAGLQF